MVPLLVLLHSSPPVKNVLAWLQEKDYLLLSMYPSLHDYVEFVCGIVAVVLQII